MTITAHTLVKNEARFVWFAVMSVIDYVDEILLWDTGSTDGTKEIIKLIERSSDKVKTNFAGEVSVEGFADVRQKMLDKTKTDWFIVVDGDEIWWQDSIRRLVETIKNEGDKLESIFVPTYNLVGDIYHYQEKAAGLYKIAGRKGHLGLRAINTEIPGLSSSNPHGTWGWTDKDGKMIQERSSKRIRFIDAPYLHASFLPRAGGVKDDRKVPKRSKKLKHEIGIPFPKGFYYPEVFFRPRPDIVPNPWQKMSREFYLRALAETPLRKLKRRLLPTKVGY